MTIDKLILFYFSDNNLIKLLIAFFIFYPIHKYFFKKKGFKKKKRNSNRIIKFELAKLYISNVNISPCFALMNAFLSRQIDKDKLNEIGVKFHIRANR